MATVIRTVADNVYRTGQSYKEIMHKLDTAFLSNDPVIEILVPKKDGSLGMSKVTLYIAQIESVTDAGEE